ncbi:unnamed protein product [Clonostachys byssicola]|uniref:Uncharacterized protein n=1 Tax=Clonostachys byssicola TaxID=160290 RepID=A0A9N9U9V9_9HYPO|nr:unnamed protein product [Clonostachys byssicola]
MSRWVMPLELGERDDGLIRHIGRLFSKCNCSGEEAVEVALVGWASANHAHGTDQVLDLVDPVRHLQQGQVVLSLHRPKVFERTAI